MPSTLVLIILIHGFKGDDTTFHKFPERLSHIVRETQGGQDQTIVESIVFPSYETRGDLGAATDRFVVWLAETTAEREAAHPGSGKAEIVLCGHSMGGLLAADALISVASQASTSTQLWPGIIGILAFDTPYLGLNPSLFKNGLTTATQHVQTARDVLAAVSVAAPSLLAWSWGGKPAPSTSTSPVPPPPPASPTPAPTASSSSPSSSSSMARGASSSSFSSRKDEPPPPPAASAWSRWSTPALYGIGAAAAAAGAAGVYIKRADVGQGFGWAQEHMQYVGALWDGARLKARLETLESLVTSRGLVFRNFYTQLAAQPGQLLPRTFCVLPPPGSATRGLWISSSNSLAKDEVTAHTEMFAPISNDAYYDLGLRAAETIALSLSLSQRRARATQGAEAETVQSATRRSSTAMSPNLSNGGGHPGAGGGATKTGARRASGARGGAFEQGLDGAGLAGSPGFGVQAEEKEIRRRASEAAGPSLD